MTDRREQLAKHKFPTPKQKRTRRFTKKSESPSKCLIDWFSYLFLIISLFHRLAPEVIDLVTGTSSSDEGASSNEEVQIVQESTKKPLIQTSKLEKPKLERPRPKSEDADIIEVLDHYAPRLGTMSASKVLDQEKGKRKRFNKLEAEFKSKPVLEDDYLEKLKVLELSFRQDIISH